MVFTSAGLMGAARVRRRRVVSGIEGEIECLCSLLNVVPHQPDCPRGRDWAPRAGFSPQDFTGFTVFGKHQRLGLCVAIGTGFASSLLLRQESACPGLGEQVSARAQPRRQAARTGVSQASHGGRAFDRLSMAERSTRAIAGAKAGRWELMTSGCGGRGPARLSCDGTRTRLWESIGSVLP